MPASMGPRGRPATHVCFGIALFRRGPRTCLREETTSNTSLHDTSDATNVAMRRYGRKTSQDADRTHVLVLSVRRQRPRVRERRSVSPLFSRYFTPYSIRRGGMRA